MPVKKKQEILDLKFNQQFRLIAISTLLSLNKVLWSINNGCGYKLSKNKELELALQVPVFSDKTSKPPIIISLIPNKLEVGNLIKQLPNVDYILEINGFTSDTDCKKTIQCIKKLDGILAAIEIIPSTIKIKEPFCPE